MFEYSTVIGIVHTMEDPHNGCSYNAGSTASIAFINIICYD